MSVRRPVSILIAVLGLLVGAAAVLSAPARAGNIVSAPAAFASVEKGDITLVDVRSSREWRETGIAAGAKTVTIHNRRGIKAFVAEMVKAVGGDKSKPVALICAAGVRSARAGKILAAAGFTNVRNVFEGMLGRPDAGPGWLKRGLPITPCPEC